MPGYAYLENSDDDRNSPSETLVKHLGELGVEVRIHDPWIVEYQGDFFAIASDCDAAIIMVAHREYSELDLDRLRQVMRAPILVDGRHVFDKVRAEAAGFRYRGVGRG